MDSVGILITMIMICLAIILIIVLAKPIQLLFRFIINAAIGVGVLSALHYMGMAIGANVLTVGVAGFLGIPGLIGLMLIQIIL